MNNSHDKSCKQPYWNTIREMCEAKIKNQFPKYGNGWKDMQLSSSWNKRIQQELEEERRLRIQAEKERDEVKKKINHETWKIGNKFRTNNNSENTSLDKDNQFEEDL